MDNFTDKLTIVSRAEWGARPARQECALNLPLSYVVIHHTYIPPVCYTREKGCQTVRAMQNFHMDDREWMDIGYNFAVGGDGIVYEGRGWTVRGSHAKNFNDLSLGVCLIGDWRTSVPPAEQLQAVHLLLEAGVKLGHLDPAYKLVGHRQVRDTECPGDALFEQIRTWYHYSPFPSSVTDLLDIKELPDEIRTELVKTLSS